jgi:MFS family permease
MSNPVAALANVVAPARLGRGFRWLLSAAIANNIGDGFMLAAGPLLMASQTHDPLLVSLAALCSYLPKLLLGSIAGVLVDRLDRRRIIMAMDLSRSLVLAALAVSIATGAINVVIVLAVLLLLSTAEVFANLAAGSLLPGLVARADLGIANARLQGSYLLGGQLFAPPIGAFLFALGMALPFSVNAVTACIGAVLISRVVIRRAAEPNAEGAAEPQRSTLRADFVEGVRWLAGHPPMRTLALTIFAFNVTFGAAWSVLVLYADQRLGMDAVGFGFLATAMAAGGLIGVTGYGWLERHFALSDIMRVGLAIETATHLVLAITTLPIVALGVMVIFGAHAFVWGTTSTAVRQRAVPDALLGRVAGVYIAGGVGGMVVGTPIGGALASSFGITAPMWFGFIGSAVLLVILWRQFGNIVHAGDHPADA